MTLTRAWTPGAGLAVLLLAASWSGSAPAAEQFRVAGRQSFEALSPTPGDIRPPGAPPIRIDIDRWSSAEEREPLHALAARREWSRLAEALRRLPPVGRVRTPDRLAYDLRYAREAVLANGARRVYLATDRPIGFWSAATGRDVDFTFIELRPALDGPGDGRLAPGQRVRLDTRLGAIAIADYASAPVLLELLAPPD